MFPCCLALSPGVPLLPGSSLSIFPQISTVKRRLTPKGVRKVRKGLAIHPLGVIVDYNTSQLKLVAPGWAREDIMTRKLFPINDLVSLSVMLLMIVALVAAQANASVYQAAVAEITDRAGSGYEQSVLPLKARMNARFDATNLTISIDASAEIRQLLREDM